MWAWGLIPGSCFQAGAAPSESIAEKSGPGQAGQEEVTIKLDQVRRNLKNMNNLTVAYTLDPRLEPKPKTL